ncbi:MAG: VOC family protein [Alphaproteobacteria bacterium]|nr:VOC family protein [Alphaproteobacteria bacterium]
MATKINHLAIISDQYTLEGKFYQSVFGTRTSPDSPPDGPICFSDGYVGFNINSRKSARPAGFDHFGFDVDDLDETIKRITEFDPELGVLKRPGSRQYASYGAHDPDGNNFDLSQVDVENRRDVYAEGEWEAPRTVDHFALRTLHPERVAAFYTEVLGLSPANRPEGDRNHYLTDGRVTMVIMPWTISDFAGTGITRPGLDHLGFKVESIDAVKAEIEDIIGRNPHLAPRAFGIGKESAARLELAKRCCPIGAHHFADPDGVLLELSEA